MGLRWPIGIPLAILLVWALEGAAELVKRRYAKGGIDRETYDRMLRDLKPCWRRPFGEHVRAEARNSARLLAPERARARVRPHRV